MKIITGLSWIKLFHYIVVNVSVLFSIEKPSSNRTSNENKTVKITLSINRNDKSSVIILSIAFLIGKNSVSTIVDTEKHKFFIRQFSSPLEKKNVIHFVLILLLFNDSIFHLNNEHRQKRQICGNIFTHFKLMRAKCLKVYFYRKDKTKIIAIQFECILILDYIFAHSFIFSNEFLIFFSSYFIYTHWHNR